MSKWNRHIYEFESYMDTFWKMANKLATTEYRGIPLNLIKRAFAKASDAQFFNQVISDDPTENSVEEAL